jgi:serine/threonine protein kinase
VPVIGQGGFSAVYLCKLPGSSENVAVKIHRCGGATRLLRAFRQELELLCKIQHPHIVRIHGFSDDHGNIDINF